MCNVIVGTAGHIDHGKTCLIKALTGINTDRLKEEKKRGITIELGFANLQNSDDTNIGIIDVPGHERFVRHMLAGIGAIDFVLLVIAANEGVMPQTVEHFEILKILGIKKGILVLTKSDIVEEDWLEMVAEDVRETVRGTFLEGAPLVAVSAHTGDNIEELKQLIFRLARDVKIRRNDASLLRIPIDRVFTIGGFGTVITGTLIEGQVSIGDEVQIYPGDKIVKVRSLQVYSTMVQTAYAGQRTAVNLLNVKKEELERGNVLAAKGTLKRSMLLDVKLKMCDDAKRVLHNESRVHLYYGSAETLCKVILLDNELLERGEESYAQLRLEREIAVRKGDHFIIRFYSPMETIGGGQILDATPKKHKRFCNDILEALRIKDRGDCSQILEQTILENGETLGIDEIKLKLGMNEADLNEYINLLIKEGRIIRLNKDNVLHIKTIINFKKKAIEILSEYHEKNPLLLGIPKNEFRRKLFDQGAINNLKIVDLLLRYFLEKAELKDNKDRIALSDFNVIYSEEHIHMREWLLKSYLECGFDIPELDELISNKKDKGIARQLIDKLTAEGYLIKIDFQHYFHVSYWNKAMETLYNQMDTVGKITLAEYRDLLGITRKYAAMILEYLDEKKITTMVDDARVLCSRIRKEL